MAVVPQCWTISPDSFEAVALEACHVEDVSGWMSAMPEGRSSTIREYLEWAEGAVSFAELVKGLGLPMVAV